MMRPSRQTNVLAKNEAKTAQSYIAGFSLSLVFTAFAYYLVVTKSLSSTSLLLAILGLAVLQMIIQLLFFLHLGRGPKPLYNVVFFAATAGIILVVVVGSILIMNNLRYNMAATDVTARLAEGERISQVGGVKTGACQSIHANHKVTISNGKLSPLHTVANLCDTLTFINEDHSVRDIAFGPHTQHEFYDGESELTVPNGYAQTITLNQSGTYSFHDHLDPGITGDFTVGNQN